MAVSILQEVNKGDEASQRRDVVRQDETTSSRWQGPEKRPWSKARLDKWSYMVEAEDGTEYCRNREQIMKTKEPAQLQETLEPTTVPAAPELAVTLINPETSEAPGAPNDVGPDGTPVRPH